MALLIGLAIPSPTQAQLTVTGDVVPVGATSPSWSAGGVLDVGATGAGSMTLSAGAAVTNTLGRIGANPGSNGTVIVNGTGATWTNTGNFFVGFNGTGSLTIENGGVVTSAGSSIATLNSGMGAVTVNGVGSAWRNNGHITVGGSSTGTLTITNGGLVATNTMTIAGPPLPGQNAGTGTLNIGAPSTAPAAPAGRLQTSSIQFGFNAHGTINFNHTDSGYTLASVMSGRGTIEQRAGTTILTGDNSGFIGTTMVSGGVLLIAAGDAGGLGGTTTVGAGAVLGGIGRLGSGDLTPVALTIAAGGVHAPGTAIGTQAVVGGYVNRGTLRIEASSTQADRVIVTGGVDISGATLDLQLSPTNANAWGIVAGPYVVIDKRSPGAVTGMFASVTNNLLFLDPTVSYAGGDGNDVTLRLVRNNVTFADIAATRNQRAVAGAIEALPETSPIWAAIAFGADPQAVRRNLDQVTGEIHASTRSMLIEDSHYVRDAVLGRTRQAGFSTSAAPQFAALAQAADQAQRPQDGTTITAWTQAFGAWGHTAGDGNAARASRSIGGVLVGADVRFADTWTVGLATGYTRSTLDINSRSSRASIDSYHLALYGGARFGALGLRLGAAHTWHSSDTSRSLSLPGLADTPRADTKARTTQLFGEAGYALGLGGVAVEPFAGLAWVHLNSNRFGERGGAAALRAASGSDSNLFSTFGVRAASAVWREDNKVLTLRGTLGWRHAFGDVTPAARLAFAGGASYGIEGVPIARNAMLVEAAFDLGIGQSMTVGAAYNGAFGSGIQDHAIKGNLTLRF
ncbi:autotransporter domain-containing protein [Reyranella sp. CPCC 100927]|uniref:autotransporter outer membrane beta-barrel domain-containing protein n=1 Tax=Reyranella sp. CPCC 100927 TaxID=2599616 RepID=UPI0015B422FF|nr:autotransporter domain-containing protein [Reyranella sp. CPCC 100927]